MRSVTFWTYTPETTSLVARRVSVSKPQTKTLLEREGIRVPAGKVFDAKSHAAAWRYVRSLGLPAVVKPTSGKGGAGVTSEITTVEEFGVAWTSAQKASRGRKVLVEKHVHGRDFRLYVVGDRVVAGVCRVPAYVKGDGRRSIAQLIADKNESRKLNPSLGSTRLIDLGPGIIHNLAEMGFTPQSVPEAGCRITLQSVANLTAGGESVDVTDEIHPDFEEIAVRSCKALPGAINAGVDVLVEDISAPPSGQEWAVCEVNTRPEIGMHHFPVWGTPRDAAGALIEHLFPLSRRYGPEEQRRVHAAISGMVTGIGFRTWIWQRANLRGLTGWVRNRDENSIEAVFCGAPNAVESMLEACRSGPRRAIVADVAVQLSAEATGDEFVAQL